ncbi:MAG: permease, partial [Deltaproteobacteria bacterium]|nr:permease [Deltaproteobacteria bacterium]
HYSFFEKIQAGLRFSITDIWGDFAGWLFIGIFLAGLISALVPAQLFVQYLGGGFSSMLIMLALGIPLYICATASTPIAAAFILKGVSPGAALVFLLVGPATNITSLSVLFGLLGKRATTIYLLTLSIFAVLCGLILDQLYIGFAFSARAVAGQAAELIPFQGQLAGAVILLALSVRPIYENLKGFFNKSSHHHADCTACDSKSSSYFPLDKRP